MLPDGNGVEICRHLKETQAKPQSYIILLSGVKTTSDYQAEGLEAGADSYIARPVSNRELLARVQAMLRLKQAEDRLKEYSEHLEEMVEERTHKLREAQDKLLRREKLAVLGQMAGSVGHELRTPLSTISNAVYYLGMITEAHDETPQEDAAMQPDAATREYLEIIRSETRRAEKIVADLLDFSRVKSLNRQEIEVADVVALVLEKHVPPDTIHVAINIPDNLPTLLADPGHVEQVLSNLVTNAFQAMLQGGTLTISARSNGDMVAIDVSDTGDGIAPEHLETIFEPLFTTKPEGIGLGLAVCKNLVEANGGTIALETREQVGTRFTVNFPTKEDAS
jgi:signal transduction histidine kinase